MGGGGAERVMLALSNGLASEGLDVDLVLVRAEGPYMAQLHSRVRVVDLKATRVLTSLPKLIRYIRRERPYSMLSTLTHANIIAVLAIVLARVPIKVVLRQCEMPSAPLSKSSSLKEVFYSHLIRWSYSKADLIVAVSNGVKCELCRVLKLPQKSVKVIYNPVVSQKIFDLSKLPVNHPWFRVIEKPVLLSAGRLSIQKDFNTLIRAFSLVVSKFECKLIILGEGDKRGELEGLIKELGIDNKVDMPGFVDNPFSYMSKATLFVFSSPSEGFPNVIVQSMAVGTPVISTDCKSGPDEILEGGKYGTLVPVGNVDIMANKILECLNNSNEFKNNSKQLIERAEYFSEKNSIYEYRSILTN